MHWFWKFLLGVEVPPNLLPQKKRPKKIYTELASVMAPVSTFAGGFTLATLFSVHRHSYLGALLSLATQLFLISPLGLLFIYLLLYGIPKDGQITGYRHLLVVAQFTIIGIFLSIAFILLSFAVKEKVETRIGTVGVLLMCLVVFGFLILGPTMLYHHSGENLVRRDRRGEAQGEGSQGGETQGLGEEQDRDPDDLYGWRWICLSMILIAEFVLGMALVGLGSVAIASHLSKVADRTFSYYISHQL